MSEERWPPFESNPETMNKFLAKVGVPTDEWAIVDVIGLDEELLGFIEGPVVALILLFPIAIKTDEDIDEQKSEDSNAENVYYMYQTIFNMCGTIALIHSVANNVQSDRIELRADSSLKAFLDSSRGLTPEQRGKLLESNADICDAHKSFAKEGQTSVPSDQTDTGQYVALVEKNGILYQLGGTSTIRRKVPQNHGNTSDETFLYDAARVCRQYIARDPNNPNFSVLALCRQNQI